MVVECFFWSFFWFTDWLFRVATMLKWFHQACFLEDLLLRLCHSFWIFLQKITVVESFFYSNYRLTVQSSDYILKWLHQECFHGNLPLGLFRSSCPQPSIFKNFSRKYRCWSPAFGQITDSLFRATILY